MLIFRPGIRHKTGAILQVLFASLVLSGFDTEAFLFQKNRIQTSHPSTNQRPSSWILDSYHPSHEFTDRRLPPTLTHLANGLRNPNGAIPSQPERSRFENILAVLCSDAKKLEILRGVAKCISQNSCKIKRILYVTSETEFKDIAQLFPGSKDLGSPDLIFPQFVRLFEKSSVTIANEATLLQYYDLLNNEQGFVQPESIQLDGRPLGKRRLWRFNQVLGSKLNSFFMQEDEIQALGAAQVPNTFMDASLLTPAGDWIERNYLDPHDLLELIKGVNKETLVFVDGFSYSYDRRTNTMTHNFKDKLLALLKPSSMVLGTTGKMYNTQQVKGWLSTLFGPVRVASVSRPPRFQILTSYGALDPFGQGSLTYGSNLGPFVNNSREVYKYFSKKSNVPKMTNINPELNEVFVRAILDALRSIGVTSYSRMVKMSEKVHDIFKYYIRSLRINPAFYNSTDKMVYLLRYMVDVAKNRTLSSLTREFNLNKIIKEQHQPSVPKLLSYLEEKGLFPAVIFKFAPDFTDLVSGFYDHFQSILFSGSKPSQPEAVLPPSVDGLDEKRRFLLKNGICTLLDTDREEFKEFVKENFEKFRLIITNQPAPSAPHYVFLDSCFKTEYGFQAMSNDQVYSLTQGSQLVTFTLDPEYTFHNLRSLLAPVYLNLRCLQTSRPTFHKFDDVLGNRLFISYLRACNAAYSRESPGYFEMKKRHSDLRSFLNDAEVDINGYVKLRKETRDIESQMKTLENSIRSKVLFRTKLIKIISTLVHINGSLILGIDRERYRLIRVGRSPGEWFKYKDPGVKKQLQNECNFSDGRAVLLKHVDRGYYLLTEISFIRDIVELGDPESVSKEEVTVDFFTSVNVNIENDLGDYINVNDMPVLCVKINTNLPIPKVTLSSLLPEMVRKKLLSQIETHKQDLERLEEVIEGRRGAVRRNLGYKDPSKQAMKLAAEEYLGLDKVLRNTKLEHVVSEHKFKNAFWGRQPVRYGDSSTERL